jgi:hypothetical protein
MLVAAELAATMLDLIARELHRQRRSSSYCQDVHGRSSSRTAARSPVA